VEKSTEHENPRSLAGTMVNARCAKKTQRLLSHATSDILEIGLKQINKMEKKEHLNKIESLEEEIGELNLVVKALREWIREDAKEIKQLQDKLDEYRKR
jgi:peptidoglycan hydrolase CwlO-like protein